MPITGRDSDEMNKMLKENWRLEEGRYVVEIEDVNLGKVTDGRKPLRWDLQLKDSHKKLDKLHWIDKEGGVKFLIDDLARLGILATPDNAVTHCNSLIGVTIEIEVTYRDDHQNITFLKRVQ